MITTVEYLERILTERKWNGTIYGSGENRYIFDTDNYKKKSQKNYVTKEAADAYESKNQ